MAFWSFDGENTFWYSSSTGTNNILRRKSGLYLELRTEMNHTNASKKKLRMNISTQIVIARGLYFISSMENQKYSRNLKILEEPLSSIPSWYYQQATNPRNLLVNNHLNCATYSKTLFKALSFLCNTPLLLL